MPTETTERGIILKHPSGSIAEVLFYGSTVISWKVPNASGELEERLFVSSKASLDGSKPVRGGIPIVFPCFGQPTHPDHLKLAQHGFARNQMWTFDGAVMDNQAGVCVKFVLDPRGNEALSAIYTTPFKLEYVVTLAAHQLSTDLHIKNPSASHTLEFQALLHSYIRAPADEVTVTPLKGLQYYDKTETTEEARTTPKVESRAEVDVKKYTDAVYENAPMKYTVSWPSGGVDIKAQNFKDVVIWNPQEEGRKIGDMESDGWKNYICVEPGYVRGFERLAPQKTWIYCQRSISHTRDLLASAERQLRYLHDQADRVRDLQDCLATLSRRIDNLAFTTSLSPAILSGLHARLDDILSSPLFSRSSTPDSLPDLEPSD
ncbi:Glucose-6-phosphate 1-epimerase [Psilocybe cubensis]|uniref:Glucose-6-phosphate 1-epimerase n=1 Tax=Psilocybe cubensis TaxID=181762 RepID=A0ACB8HG86_PSICU|nr:Glucose-6-phosphate 1-epimerase [Psilocybe cubensis]KAH9486923.1 Glucose-6-phosphate 1-epimerase [Psilocybe cubensis]